MYPEYIGIYICLGIIITMQAVIIVMIKKVISNLYNNVKSIDKFIENKGRSGYVLCTKCEQMYSADKKICPYCGTKR